MHFETPAHYECILEQIFLVEMADAFLAAGIVNNGPDFCCPCSLVC